LLQICQRQVNAQRMSHVTRHTSHVTRHTSSGTLSWTQHGYVARAKVEKKNRRLFAKRKVQPYIRCDFFLATLDV
jgi:hypothetical protein